METGTEPKSSERFTESALDIQFEDLKEMEVKEGHTRGYKQKYIMRTRR